MKFKEIIKRLNGISTPVFGVSWNPNQTDKDHAREVITYLEDRRVLYAPSEMEQPHYCVQSVLEIRRFLTQKIAGTHGKDLQDSLRAMRAACRKFLDTVGADSDVVRYGNNAGHWASWTFNGAIGELRGVFGIHVAKIAVMYGLDIEEDLAKIIPFPDTEGSGAAAD